MIVTPGLDCSSREVISKVDLVRLSGLHFQKGCDRGRPTPEVGILNPKHMRMIQRLHSWINRQRNKNSMPRASK
ncbi:hypothetical protein KONIH1_18530 [Klebsiella oxytoca KONIH1]|nr:hypothetical protein KONIH1_18530 [Klebsiella oxytoca KONIH1]POT86224.1 hypothetical protein C3417_21995 [Klebsiella oxytoca]POV50155.1 hypothetical protein C3409_14875 [Klebsiella oxytoca]